jgi:hypothetical protein
VTHLEQENHAPIILGPVEPTVATAFPPDLA